MAMACPWVAFCWNTQHQPPHLPGLTRATMGHGSYMQQRQHVHGHTQKSHQPHMAQNMCPHPTHHMHWVPHHHPPLHSRPTCYHKKSLTALLPPTQSPKVDRPLGHPLQKQAPEHRAQATSTAPPLQGQLPVAQAVGQEKA